MHDRHCRVISLTKSAKRRAMKYRRSLFAYMLSGMMWKNRSRSKGLVLVFLLRYLRIKSKSFALGRINSYALVAYEISATYPHHAHAYTNIYIYIYIYICECINKYIYV